MPTQTPERKPAPNYRAELTRLMRETLADQHEHGLWTYQALRPMPVPAAWRRGDRVFGDCSKGVQYLCRWAGVPTDPMGGGWGPYGNSSTLCVQLTHLATRGELRVGDIVTFGRYGSEHAAMVLETGPNPLLWSFGHQGAPSTYFLSQDRRPYQLLRLPVPDYVPTPADRLRARTDWFAWVAWRLGEGDWKTYGKTNPSVRPNVSKVIKPTWWRAYAAFLAARSKGNKPKGPR